jgi:hypothetical protein
LDERYYGGMMDKQLNFDSNTVLDIQLPAPDLQIIVLALKELPYKHAQPVIDRLFEQLQPKEDADGSVE